MNNKLSVKDYVLGWTVICVITYLGIRFFSSPDNANNYIPYVAIVLAIICFFGYRDEKKKNNKADKKGNDTANLMKENNDSKVNVSKKENVVKQASTYDYKNYIEEKNFLTRYEFDRITKRNAIIFLCVAPLVVLISPFLAIVPLVISVILFANIEGNKPVKVLSPKRPLDNLSHGSSFKEKLSTIWEGVPFDIRFEYEDNKGNITKRKLQLQRIGESKLGEIYLIGHCHTRNEQRSFRYDRIQGDISYSGHKSSDVSELIPIAEKRNAYYQKIDPVEVSFQINDSKVVLLMDHFDFTDEAIIAIGGKIGKDHITFYLVDINSDINVNDKTYSKNEFIEYLSQFRN